jgi:type II secretory pathway component PulF
MATCLASGLSPTKSLELSAKGTRSPILLKIAETAKVGISQGLTLSESLRLNKKYFPHYFIPLLKAGETGGRLVEAFQLLSDHCRQLVPSLKLVRNTWLYPLVCIVFGWILRTGIYLYFGKPKAAWDFFLHSFGTGFLLFVSGWFLIHIPKVRFFIDRILLQLPVIRETEVSLANVLFFATFRLVYDTGGIGVVNMFDLAKNTVRNMAIRADFIRAREMLASGGSFEDAFESIGILEDRYKSILTTGAASGTLDQSLSLVLDMASQQLAFTLKNFNALFQRIVAFCVAMSVVETIFICVM